MKSKLCMTLGAIIFSLFFALSLNAGTRQNDFYDTVIKNLSLMTPVISVTIENKTLKIVTGMNKVKDSAYYMMVPSVCLDLKAFPDIAKQFKEIVFLNKWKRQGWVFEEPSKYNEILKTPMKELKIKIAPYTHMHSN